MDKKRSKFISRKARSSSRVSSRARYSQDGGSTEETGPSVVHSMPMQPNTQITSPKQSLFPQSMMLPFGKPSLKKAATSRQRRTRQHSTIPPVRRCLYEKRESDSSSSHSVQDSVQQSKQKILEKSRQKAKSSKKPEDDASWIYQIEESSTPLTSADEMEGSVRTACSMQTYEKNIAACLKAFASMCDTLSIEMLRNQFYSLPQPDPKEFVVFADRSNASKNRYSNIPCLDATRILLEFLLFEDGGGYIHANRVTYPLLRNDFILTQGPLIRTVPEFWRMIWQEKTETIIMLCKTLENGRRKCAEYFSNHINVPITFVNGMLSVCLRSRNKEDDLIVSTLELKYLSYIRTIIHYQWIEWPDCQAPTENAQTMFTILRRVRGSKTPVVVHCSAGVGRSGTLVALEMCLMTIANTRPLDIHSIVSSLRRCRALAVQSFEQYLSLYKLVLQFGQQNGCIATEDVEGFYRLIQTARL